MEVHWFGPDKRPRSWENRACAALSDAVPSYIIMQHTAAHPPPSHPIRLTDFEPDWMLLKRHPITRAGLQREHGH